MTIEGAKLAVLIDAENAQASQTSELLSEIAKYGVAVVKRAYGDWTRPTLAGWKVVVQRHGILQVQQLASLPGKNSSDFALVIDAMDLLHPGKFDGFCLMTSDSDFTRLACRIREAGLSVYGFGNANALESFRNSCTKFITVKAKAIVVSPPKVQVLPKTNKPTKAPASTQNPAQKIESLVIRAFEDCGGKDGSVALSALGTAIKKIDPAFEVKKFGHSQLGKLVMSLNCFEVKKDGEKGHKTVSRKK